MKTSILLITLLSLFDASAFAQQAATNTPAPSKIRAADAGKYVGAKTVVAGTVAEVNKTARLVHLNLDKPYPDEPFTAVIFARSTNLFPNLDELKGKAVEVSGTITAYRGQPQIVLTNSEQLKVVEKAGSAKQAGKK